mgnify:CR=1 FL=1
MTNPEPGRAASPSPNWLKDDLFDKLPDCFRPASGDPANPSPKPDITKCLQEINEYTCDDIKKLITDAHKNDPKSMPPEGTVRKVVDSLVDKLKKDKDMVNAVARAFVGSIDKLQCAVEGLNDAYDLKGDSKIEDIPVDEIKRSLSDALGCCELCVSSPRGMAALGITAGVLLVIAVVAIVFCHRRCR